MAKQTTPHQALRLMATRAFFTQLLAERNWRVPDLIRAVGWPKGYTPPYVWVTGKGAPSASTVALMEKKLRIKIDLGPNSPALAEERKPLLLEGASNVGDAGVARAPIKTKPLLEHQIFADGTAFLRIEGAMSAKHSLRIIAIMSDAGLIPEGEG